MTAFRTLTFVPLDGTLSITLPESLRGKKVKLSAEPDRKNEVDDSDFQEELGEIRMMSEEERHALLYPLGEDFFDSLSSPRSKEEHLAWMDKFRGSLRNVDYSDFREETDREI